jgi:hypothetical protein
MAEDENELVSSFDGANALRNKANLGSDNIWLHIDNPPGTLT